MKFLCDRCKTRYTIADERVRGKILKIRCKNCANVITVREGQAEPVESAEVVDAAEMSAEEREASVVARRPGATAQLATAAAAITADPPSVLDEEWFVSIDGVQTGPLTLAGAQAWIRKRPASDELYCWSEGFDAWLLVDKVNHFRGLRGSKRPATVPPPVPAGSRSPEEPKSLFAATMAAVEDEAAAAEAASASNRKFPRAATPRPAPPQSKAADSAPVAAVAAPPAAAESIAASKFDTSSESAATSKPAEDFETHTPPPQDAASLARPSSNDLKNAGKGGGNKKNKKNKGARDNTPAPAKVDAPVASKPEHVAAPVVTADAAKTAEPEKTPAPVEASPAPPPEASSPPSAPADDDDLAIGEVSRVVRIADLGRPGPRAAAAGAVVRAQPAVGTAPVAAASTARAANLIAGGGPRGISDTASPPFAPASAKKRGSMMIMIIGVLVVLVGAIVVVVMRPHRAGGDNGFVASGTNDSYGNLGLHSDDPHRANPVANPGTGSGSAVAVDPAHKLPQNPPTNSGNPGGIVHHDPVPPGPGSNAAKLPLPPIGGPDGPITELTPDDVQAMYREKSMGTQRCWEQAQKKDPFIDAKKINATLAIDKTGVVTDVNLSAFGGEFLGQCLAGRIKLWKFHASPAGLHTQLTFAFQKT